VSLNLKNSFIKNEKDLINNFVKTYSNSIFHDFTSLGSISENNIISVAVNPDNGFMIAVVNDASSNDLAYSNDNGLSWIFYAKDLTATWKSVTYGNGKFIVVGGGPTNYIMYSTSSTPTNSTNWTLLITPIQSWIKVIHHASTFVAISSNSSSTRKIGISSDGITWTLITPPSDISTNAFSDITYGNGRFVIITINISGLNNVIYSNDNGLTWYVSNRGSISSDSSNSSPKICYSSKLEIFLILNVSDQTKISYSKGGDKWIIGNKGYSDSWSEINQLIWINELEIFVLFGLYNSKFIISTSFDGINWARKFTDLFYKKFTSLIWNRYYGSLIGVSTYVTTSTDVSILITKPLGINHLINSRYYSNNQIPQTFFYNIPNYSTAINTTFSIHPILDINNDFIEYSITPSLPNGVTINAYNGVISGSATNIHSLTQYIVSAKHLVTENTIKTKINIEITTSLNSISLFYYNNNSDAIININTFNVLYIPSFIGSRPTNFSLKSGSLPPGLFLRRSNGEIYGDISLPYIAGSYTAIITATNSLGSLDATFKIVINDASVQDFSYNDGYVIKKFAGSYLDISPSINSGTNITYSVSPSFSGDFSLLNLNTSTGRIYGTLPNTYKNSYFIITALNSTNTKTHKIDININDNIIFPSGLSYNDINITANSSITVVPILNYGTTPITYTISPSLPSGLSIDSNTGVISGTPINIQNIVSYTITASNSIGTTDANINIKINAPIIAPTGLSYNNINTIQGTTITPVNPTLNAGTSPTYTVSPSLPTGLSINSSTGVISGTPISAQSLTFYTITATNISGNTTALIGITINAIIAPSGLSYSNLIAVINVFTSLSPTLIAGTSPITYTIPSLPTGLSINSSTGVISGTPTILQNSSSYTVTATNSVGSTNTSFNITVKLADVAPTGLSYNGGSPAIQLISTSVSYSPTLNSGTNITYSITPTLPSGLSLNTSTGVISGTTPSFTNDTTYTVTATNITLNSSTSTSFRIRIVFFQGTINPKGMGNYSYDPSFQGYGYNSGEYVYGGDTYDDGVTPQPVGALSNNGSYTIGACIVYDYTGDGGGYASYFGVKGNHVSLSSFTKIIINGTTYLLSDSLWNKNYSSGNNYTYFYRNNNVYPGTFAFFHPNTSGTVTIIIE